MPYQSEFESNGIYTKFHGRLHADEIEAVSRRLRSHRRVASRLAYCVCDFLDVDEIVITHFEILMLAAHDHQVIELSPALKIAIVAADARVAAIAALYADSPLMRRNARIFGALDDAYGWVAANAVRPAGETAEAGVCAV